MLYCQQNTVEESYTRVKIGFGIIYTVLCPRLSLHYKTLRRDVFEITTKS